MLSYNSYVIYELINVLVEYFEFKLYFSVARYGVGTPYLYSDLIILVTIFKVNQTEI